jgi:hypothetical protein
LGRPSGFWKNTPLSSYNVNYSETLNIFLGWRVGLEHARQRCRPQKCEGRGTTGQDTGIKVIGGRVQLSDGHASVYTTGGKNAAGQAACIAIKHNLIIRL